MFALLGHYYAWASPSYIYNEMTFPQIMGYLDEINNLEYRKSLPSAQLALLVGNQGLGGKYKEGKAPPVDKKKDDKEPYTLVDMLYPHQMPDFLLEEEERKRVRQERKQRAAHEVRESLHTLPDWAYQVLPLDEIERLTG